MLRVGSLGSSETTLVGPAESGALYSAGHLLFRRGTSLMAQPFNVDSRQLAGDPFQVVDQFTTAATTTASPLFSVSTTGVLVYGAVRTPQSQLTWFDRAGKPRGTVGPPGTYFNLGLSRDEHRLAVSHDTGSPSNVDIWLFDLPDGTTSTRLTLDPAGDFDPTWSPDGTYVVFNSLRSQGPGSGVRSLYRHAVSGGPDEFIVQSAGDSDWSPDGRFLAYTLAGDVWVVPFTGDRKPFAFLQPPFDETILPMKLEAPPGFEPGVEVLETVQSRTS